MNIANIIRLLSAVKRMRHNERISRAQLESYQQAALGKMRENAYSHSKFYQKYHHGLTNRPLNELPIMTKKILMENFNELVTDSNITLADVRNFIAQHGDKMSDKRKYLGRYWVNATSGSSGHPGIFLYNADEWISVLASFSRGREWSGIKIALLPRLKNAMVASISSWHMSSMVALTARTWSTPFIHIPATAPLGKIVQQLNHWQPDLLIAYSTMAHILAEEQLGGRLHISPKKIFTSAEKLTGQARHRIQSAWGNELYNQYGTTETANIAGDYHICHRMHVYEDLLIVENVDEDNRPVPRGEYGAKLLVTTLYSRTQPLIRYEINDSVKFSAKPCPDCDLPFAIIDDIQGRVDKMFYMPGYHGKSVLIQPVVFNRLMDILPIKGWQVVQNNDDSLTVFLSGYQGDVRNDTLVENFKRELSAEGVNNPKIDVQFVKEISKSASGKTTLIIPKNLL